MNRPDVRSWFVSLVVLAVTSLGCGSGASVNGEGDGNGDGSGADAGDSDSSVGWDSGFPPDDGFDPGCTAKTCSQLGANCGPIDNGCGKLIDCGTCSGGKTCGAEGQPNVCGMGECLPKSCDELGLECGMQGDGCETVLDCGTCPQPEFCGGGGPNKCGRGVNCDNLCKQQVTCPGAETTRLSGIVYNPAGTIPLYGALVYVPNAELEHFPDEVRCGACEDEVSGKPLVVATTNYKGEFILEDVPVGNDIPLVIQLGRWRKVVTIPKVEACEDNVAPTALTRLPQRHKEDGNPFNNIPRMAMVTGSADALERMIAKTGISCDEFKNAAFPDPGRVHFYRRNGAYIGSTASTPSQESLLDSPEKMAKYDMILLACPSSATNAQATDARRKNLAEYTAAGGRVFTTHFGYTWIKDNPHGAFNQTATWSGSQANSGQPIVNQAHPKGADFANWLLDNSAATTSGPNVVVSINDQKHDARAVLGDSVSWIQTPRPSVLHYTFDTPVSAPSEDRCGRVLFSGFHVTAAATSDFAGACSGLGAPSPQEKMLQFMMFDLASCALPEAPTCTPLSCEDYGYDCGPAGDGCGGILDCGECKSGICGGDGPGKCGGGQCKPRTCQEQSIECGEAGDGCGNKIDCGTCTAPQWCGGAGPGKCGGIK